MTTATTSIVITAKDSTAAAFASVNSGLGGLASNALKVTGALSAIGAGAVIGSMAAFAKQTIDAQDNLFKLSQKTGLAVESLAGLEFAAEQSGVELDKVARATRAFSLLVVESADATSSSAKKLQSLGLEYKNLKDLTPEKQLLALADALNKFSREDRAVAFTSAFGQKMADLIPLLSGGSKNLEELIAQGKKLNPVTEESARKSEQFNDQINLLNKSVSALGREMVQGIIPSLTRVSNEMIKAAESGGLLSGALAGIKQLFIESFGNPKILGDVGQIRREILKTQDAIGKISANKDSVFFDKNALDHEKEKLTQLEIDLQSAIGKSREMFAAQDANAASTKKFTIATEDSGKALTAKSTSVDKLTARMNDQSRIESEYIKLLKAERQAQEDLLRPYQQSARSAQDRLESMQQEVQALALSKANQISLEQAIELTTIARLEEKAVITKESGAVAAINQEIAARKQMVSIIQSRDAQAAGDRIRSQELQAYDQFSIQAARNIQTNLAFGIEQGFRNGFKSGISGLLNGIANTVADIVSQVLAQKLLQSSGIGGSLGLFGGGGGGASGAFNIASIGSNAASLLRGGFGIPSLIGGGLRAVGSGSVAAFGGGLAGDAIGGLAAGGFTSGAASAASMGAAIGAVAGPLMVAFVATQGFRALAGDKRIGGGFGKGLNAVGDIPILGDFLPIIPLLNGLFGRGPMKFRQQSLQGTASQSGFDGDITNVFRAKGGLLVGNKHKSVTEQFSLEQQTLFDATLKGFYGAAHNFAENLGLSTDLVDGFTKDIQIKSEKGKQLTEEAITSMLQGIGNDIAKNVLPIADDLRKAGEDSFATLSRLSDELSSVTNAGRILGLSLADSRSIMLGVAFDVRTAFIDAAGGAQSFNEKLNFVAQNFLTPQRRLEIASESLNKQLTDLSVSADITKDQFFELLQQTAQLGDAAKFSGLLDVADDLTEVRDAAAQASGKVDEFGKSITDWVALADKFVNDRKLKVLADAKDRNAFTAGRRDIQLGRAAAPTIATSVNGKILTESDIRQQQQSAIDESRAQVQSIFQEQLSRLSENFSRLTDGIKNSISEIGIASKFFAGLKDSFIAIQSTSRASALTQISVATELAKAGADIKLIDTPELSNAIGRLKNTTDEIFSSRRDFELAKAEGANQIKSLSDIGITKADETLSVLKDQLEVQQKSFVLQEQQIKQALVFAGGGADLISNNALASQGSKSLSALIQSSAIQMGTSFLGSVRFPDPAQFTKLQNQLRTKISGASTDSSMDFSALLTEIKNLRQEIKSVKDATEGTNNLLNSVTRGGRAMSTTPA